MDARVPLAGDHLFRPETFFLGRTEGSGLVRPLIGGPPRHCNILTVGERRASYGALSLTETFEYDDGELDVWRWVISSSGDGRYIASEQAAGSGIAGHHIGEDYALTFRRPLGRAKGPLAPRYHTRFTLLGPDIAVKRVKVTLFGAPVASFIGVHRRVSG